MAWEGLPWREKGRGRNRSRVAPGSPAPLDRKSGRTDAAEAARRAIATDRGGAKASDSRAPDRGHFPAGRWCESP